MLNYETWMKLSPESRSKLCQLLPSSVFGDHVQGIDDFHPSRRHIKAVESNPNSSQVSVH